MARRRTRRRSRGGLSAKTIPEVEAEIKNILASKAEEHGEMEDFKKHVNKSGKKIQEFETQIKALESKKNTLQALKSKGFKSDGSRILSKGKLLGFKGKIAEMGKKKAIQSDVAKQKANLEAKGFNPDGTKPAPTPVAVASIAAPVVEKASNAQCKKQTCATTDEKCGNNKKVPCKKYKDCVLSEKSNGVKVCTAPASVPQGTKRLGGKTRRRRKRRRTRKGKRTKKRRKRRRKRTKKR